MFGSRVVVLRTEQGAEPEKGSIQVRTRPVSRFGGAGSLMRPKASGTQNVVAAVGIGWPGRWNDGLR